jgi:hypothetical protein
VSRPASASFDDHPAVCPVATPLEFVGGFSGFNRDEYETVFERKPPQAF